MKNKLTILSIPLAVIIVILAGYLFKPAKAAPPKPPKEICWKETIKGTSMKHRIKCKGKL